MFPSEDAMNEQKQIMQKSHLWCQIPSLMSLFQSEQWALFVFFFQVDIFQLWFALNVFIFFKLG